MKKLKKFLFHFPKIAGAITAAFCLLYYTESTQNGVRDGLTLLGSVVIPSLFPFLVLSSYLCECPSFFILSKKLKTPVHKIFKTPSYSVLPIIMGLIGGYPTGAKTVASLHASKKLSQKEAEHLLFWCVNPGPAFCINAVGSIMLKSTKAGIILYSSTVLSATTIGLFMRIFKTETDGCRASDVETAKQNTYPLITAVTDGCSAILNISAWILLFSCFFGLLNEINIDKSSVLFIKSVLEVTAGSKACAGNTSLPLISALLGFGGICVFCQILPFLTACKMNLKNFICARVVNASLCGFYTSLLIKLFPRANESASVIASPFGSLYFSYTVPVFCVLLMMCGIFILQLDNRKKI